MPGWEDDDYEVPVFEEPKEDTGSQARDALASAGLLPPTLAPAPASAPQQQQSAPQQQHEVPQQKEEGGGCLIA